MNGTVIAKAKKGDDLTLYRAILGKCPFCEKDMIINNQFHRYPPVNIIHLKCSTHNIDYKAKITKSKIVVFEIESLEVVSDE